MQIDPVRLHHLFGLGGHVLEWFRSYLTGRSLSVWYNGEMSNMVALLYGVPQGSVLGPLLFVLYLAEVFAVVKQFGFLVHGYDDLQLYDHAAPSASMSLVSRLSDCVEAVKAWMASSRLCLNSSKTELIWLGASRYVQLCPTGPVNIAGASIRPSQQVRDLGVVLDSELSLAAHVSHITSVCYCHIRQLRLLRRSLSFQSINQSIFSLL